MTVSMLTSQKLEDCGTPLLAPKGAMIFDRREYAEGAYLMLEGRVSLSLASESGLPLWSRAVGPGMVLGLPAAIAVRPQGLRAVATKPARLRFVTREQLSSLIRDDTEIAIDVLQVLCREIACAYRRLVRLRME